MSKVGDESGAADISMGLVVVPECEISAEGWRAVSNMNDITVGEENIEIPRVNEINDDIAWFQKGFAYTVDGVLKEDVVEERISEARDQRKQGILRGKPLKERCIKCGCPTRCGNREFFTPNGKGWGLRTLERSPEGAFVCEYTGEIVTIPKLYQRSFEDKLTSPVILDGVLKNVLRITKLCVLTGHVMGISHGSLTTDVNLIEIPVHVETPDQHYYHITANLLQLAFFFTTRDIEAMEELTWDYYNDDYRMKPFDSAGTLSDEGVSNQHEILVAFADSLTLD
ncbi:unnamed protein product [Arabis nemorensis]|uniref:SET domain-containing protein n=1 Tax=Arabis nemorensis TaxID=586526 RepID=A0A565CEJ6_9BRAS|nr:unnamed protein product [Arabis nemorensis]